jgi:hypothetical protein
MGLSSLMLFGLLLFVLCIVLYFYDRRKRKRLLRKLMSEPRRRRTVCLAVVTVPGRADYMGFKYFAPLFMKLTNADGTYSFSQSRRGTCSHHGGVAKWLWSAAPAQD